METCRNNYFDYLYLVLTKSFFTQKVFLEEKQTVIYHHRFQKVSFFLNQTRGLLDINVTMQSNISLVDFSTNLTVKRNLPKGSPCIFIKLKSIV